MPHVRLPRFKRSTEISPIRLTARDREILQHVHRHRFLRSDHIAALTGGSQQRILRRLQRLYHHGHLDRPRCQIDYFQSGSRRMAYGLGNKGAAWLKRELSLPYHQLDWPRKNHVRRFFLEHALLVSDFMVALEIACRSRQDVRVLAADAKRGVHQWSVDIGHSIKCGVIPDRVFGLEFNGKCCWYCLEADRGTMPVIRSGLERTSFHRKLLAYAATWKQGVHRTRFGWQRFRVLTVTSDSRRIKAMTEACRKLEHGRGLFLFCDIKKFQSQTDVLSICWQTAHDGDSIRLL